MNSAARPALIVFLLAPVAFGEGGWIEVLAKPHLTSKHGTKFKLPRDHAGELRDDALKRAIVWLPPAEPIGQANLRENPPGPGSFRTTDEIDCRFEVRDVGGHMPKFYCILANGDSVKVKYAGPELYTETAASRLLLALGFGADRVSLVRKVRCYGCPDDPFAVLQCLASPLEDLRQSCLPQHARRSGDGWALDVDYSKFKEFAPAAIERRMPGQTIEATDDQGWGWDELDEKGDSPSASRARAEREALRLLAVFLGHWDNKASNQRLSCLPGPSSGNEHGRCAQPIAFISDVGGTFGSPEGERPERKINVAAWESIPIWSDPARCGVTIKARMFRRATFGSATISEPGRQLLAKLLSQLSEAQIADLFEGSGFADRPQDIPGNGDLHHWVKAFQGKVSQIADREPCPMD